MISVNQYTFDRVAIRSAGNPTKEKFGWEAQVTPIELIRKMVLAATWPKPCVKICAAPVASKPLIILNDLTSISPAQSMLNSQTRIFVAGIRGMVGSAIMRRLRPEGYQNIITHTHRELDLTEQQPVRDFFHKEKNDYVVLAATKVDGIYTKNTYPANFIAQNLQIQTNIIHKVFKAGVRNLLLLGGSRICPKLAPQLLKEDYLLTKNWTPACTLVTKLPFLG